MSKTSIVVNAPVDKVFNYIIDFRRHVEWDGDWDLPFRRISEGPITVGFTCDRQGTRKYDKAGGGGSVRVVTKVVTKTHRVAEFSPGERVTFEVTKTERDIGSDYYHPHLGACLRSQTPPQTALCGFPLSRE